MDNIHIMSTDQLLTILQWAADRRAYCALCGKRSPNDAAAEDAACAELTRRGYFTA